MGRRPDETRNGRGAGAQCVPPYSRRFGSSPSPERGGGCRRLVLCRFAPWRSEIMRACSEPVREARRPPAAMPEGVELRQVAVPPRSPACLLYCQAAPSPAGGGGWGEVFAVAGLRDASVARAEGLHSGRNVIMIMIMMGGSYITFSLFIITNEKLAIHAAPRAGEREGGKQ